MSSNERRIVKLTPQQRARHAEIRRQVQKDQSQITREALEHLAERDALIAAFKMLKAERKRCGLSLADVAKRSGVGKSYLSKLENDPAPNTTFNTLLRIAKALGVRLTIGMSRGAA